MSKKKRRAKKKRRIIKSRSLHNVQEKKPINWIRFSLKTVAVIFALVGFSSAMLSLLPKISLNPGVALYSSNPLDIIFTISNDGPFTIKNITYEIDVRNLSSEGSPKIEMHGNGNIKFVNTEPEITELKTGEKDSFQRTLPIKGNFLLTNKPEIVIDVFFKPYGLFKIKRRFRYLAVKDHNNQWQWIPKATSEKF